MCRPNHNALVGESNSLHTLYAFLRLHLIGIHIWVIKRSKFKVLDATSKNPWLSIDFRAQNLQTSFQNITPLNKIRCKRYLQNYKDTYASIKQIYVWHLPPKLFIEKTAQKYLTFKWQTAKKVVLMVATSITCCKLIYQVEYPFICSFT